MQASEHSLTATALNKIFVWLRSVFLTATLKKCFFIMLWLNSFKGGRVSTFDIKLVCLIHMRKASDCVKTNFEFLFSHYSTLFNCKLGLLNHFLSVF